MKLPSLALLLCMGLCFSCADYAAETPSKENPTTPKDESQTAPPPAATINKPRVNYDRLRTRITYGQAKLAEVFQALTEQDVGALTNTVHALYSMRWHRGVTSLLDDLWLIKKEKRPELAWELLAKPPVRIALASTINRIKTFETHEYLEYIRAHQDDAHEFHRAQVVIALGFNGDPKDVPYLKKMADGDNHYVAQTAITGLALMNDSAAKHALVELLKKYDGDNRGDLIQEVLIKAYNWTIDEAN